MIIDIVVNVYLSARNPNIRLPMPHPAINTADDVPTNQALSQTRSHYKREEQIIQYKEVHISQVRSYMVTLQERRNKKKIQRCAPQPGPVTDKVQLQERRENNTIQRCAHQPGPVTDKVQLQDRRGNNTIQRCAHRIYPGVTIAEGTCIHPT